MLCKKCSKNMYIANIGHCHNCGNATSSGMFTLCTTCSKSKDECQHCRTTLSDQDDGGDEQTD